MDQARRQETGDFVAWLSHVMVNCHLPQGERPRTPADCHPLKKGGRPKKRTKVPASFFIKAMAKGAVNVGRKYLGD